MVASFRSINGFETGGLEESHATQGAPSVQSTIKRSGGYALELAPAATQAWYDAYNIAFNQSSGLSDTIIGFSLRLTDTTPGAQFSFYEARGTAGGGKVLSWGLRLETDGDLVLLDEVGAAAATATAPFTADTHHFIEIFYNTVSADSVTFKIYVDGTQVINVSGVNADADSLVFSRFQGADSTAGNPTVYIDDFYTLSTITDENDKLGNFVVLNYQTTDEDATDLGDALENGTWALVSETPVNEGTSNDAGYTSTPKAGGTQTDSGARPGPSGDTRITGTPTIKAALWIHRLLRGTGAASTHQKRYGNSGDGMTDTTVTLTTSYQNFGTFSEAATVIPTASEYFQHGFNVSGAQDITCAEIWAMLGFVPGSAFTAAMAAAFETQHVPALHLRGWKAIGYDNG